MPSTISRSLEGRKYLTPRCRSCWYNPSRAGLPLSLDTDRIIRFRCCEATAGYSKISIYFGVNARSSSRAASLKSFNGSIPSAFHQVMQLADRLVRCEVGADRCFHELLCGSDSSQRGQDAHPAD